MITETTPIEQYLKNQSNETEKKDIDYYVNRVSYYWGLLNSSREIEQARGFGEVEFYLDHQGVKNMFAFWTNAMVGFMESTAVNAYRKKIENGKGKNKKDEA